MPTNAYMYFVAAIIPLMIGAAYYHPKVLGTAWMRASNLTEDDLKGGNMALIFGGAYFLCVLIAFALTNWVIHQSNVVGLLIPEVFEAGSAEQRFALDFLEQYGDRHRTFTHGMVHGGMMSVFLILPILGVNALFERKGWKYVFIHFGYWFITLMLMGGVICQTLEYGSLN